MREKTQMAKPLEMTIQVEEVAFGKVFRTLDTMPGVVSIALHGTDHKAKPAPSTAPVARTGGATTECLILGRLRESSADRPTLVEAIVAGGKSATSYNAAMGRLKKNREVIRAANGSYRITSAGAKRYETACAIDEEG